MANEVLLKGEVTVNWIGPSASINVALLSKLNTDFGLPILRSSYNTVIGVLPANKVVDSHILVPFSICLLLDSFFCWQNESDSERIRSHHTFLDGSPSHRSVQINCSTHTWYWSLFIVHTLLVPSTSLRFDGKPESPQQVAGYPEKLAESGTTIRSFVSVKSTQCVRKT